MAKILFGCSECKRAKVGKVNSNTSIMDAPTFNTFALKTAKTLLSFGCFACKWVEVGKVSLSKWGYFHERVDNSQ